MSGKKKVGVFVAAKLKKGVDVIAKLMNCCDLGQRQVHRIKSCSYGLMKQSESPHLVYQHRSFDHIYACWPVVFLAVLEHISSAHLNWTCLMVAGFGHWCEGTRGLY